MKKKSITLLFITCLTLVVLFSLPPVSQDLLYHDFADTLEVAGISNFMNVLSNLPFVVIGIIGLMKTMNYRSDYLPDNALLFFYAGVFFTGLGSAYYHYSPDNITLVWDRLPMAMTFMALLSVIISLHINERTGQKLLLPLISAGILSVFYWYITELHQHGDLRPYIFIQFYPMVIIPIIVCMFPVKGVFIKLLLPMIGFYIIAKLLEHTDDHIYGLTTYISGHTLKHIFSALAVVPVLNVERIYKSSHL